VSGILVLIVMPKTVARVATWIEGKQPVLKPLTTFVGHLSTTLTRLTKPMVLAKLVAISLVAWLIEGTSFIAVGHAIGLNLAIPVYLLALVIATLSTVIPSSPGYIGTYHYFVALVVVSFGADRADGVALAVLVHLLLWTLGTASGFLLLTRAGFGVGMRTRSMANLPACGGAGERII
jgi:hypothetical protein